GALPSLTISSLLAAKDLVESLFTMPLHSTLPSELICTQDCSSARRSRVNFPEAAGAEVEFALSVLAMEVLLSAFATLESAGFVAAVPSRTLASADFSTIG